MSQAKYSILLASRNEGDSLRRTIDDILPKSADERLELIVVDDDSEDGSTDFLEPPSYSERPLTVLRNDRRRGLIFSRARAAEAAIGEYLVFLDAHCAVSPGWLRGFARELERVDGEGLVAPWIFGLDSERWAIDLDTDSAQGCSILNPFLDFMWTSPVRVDGLLCSCTIGGGAWMCSREWYNHIGGLDEGMIHWGGENVDIPLRTWVAGGWCLVADSVRVGHLFRPRDPRSAVQGVDVIYNKIRAAHNVFAKETFRKVVGNLSVLSGFEEALERIQQDREAIGLLKAHVESIRKRSDRWILETFRLPCLEPPFFHKLSRGQQRRMKVRPRPLVSVVISGAGGDDKLKRVASSVSEHSTYGNYEMIVVASGERRSAADLAAEGALDDAENLRVLQSSESLGGGQAENLATQLSDAEYIAFLSEDVVILDPHWIEKFIILFERRTRLLLASPRLTPVDEAGERDGRHDDVFDVTWDWDASGFARERVGEPPAAGPCQALSCPDPVLFVHRERFVELGGFDRTVRRGARPVTDLAIHGWLSGYEVFCHPQITFGRRNGHEVRDPRAAGREYSQVLPAVKYFTQPLRLECARQLSPRAEKILVENEEYLRRRRRQFLAYARFQDDWLFFKFGIEELPNGGQIRTALRAPGTDEATANDPTGGAAP